MYPALTFFVRREALCEVEDFLGDLSRGHAGSMCVAFTLGVTERSRSCCENAIFSLDCGGRICYNKIVNNLRQAW